MKRNNLILSFAIASVFLLSQCSKQEVIPVVEEHQTKEMSFRAVIEKESLTKTILDDEASLKRRVLWLNSDSIGVLSQGKTFAKFIYTGDDSVSQATFDGRIIPGDNYVGIYPYNSNCKMSENLVSIILPTSQKYLATGFESGTFPMITKSKNDELHFKNLCGILQLNLKGEVTVKSIMISASTPLSGEGAIDTSYVETPALVMDVDGDYNVILDCGEGVALNNVSSTSFYFVLPPAKYPSLTFKIIADGKTMTKTSGEVTIYRSGITPSAPLAFVEDPSIDLSSSGTANSYIVSREGFYSITATQIGNGSVGIIPGSNFHTSSATIAPASAGLLWEDVDGLIENVTLDEGIIRFIVSSDKGNAVIAAYSGANCTGNILWSWHIWCTDTPAIEVYSNYVSRRYEVQDRNLGATRANIGSTEAQRKATYGLYYQWGRKDPFEISYFTTVERSETTGTILHTVKNPNVFIIKQSNWLYSGINNYLWGNPTGYNYTSTLVKTIYDPCPTGYMVPPIDFGTRFSLTGTSKSGVSYINASGSFDKGWNFYYQNDKKGNTSWYPAAGLIYYSDGSISGFEGNGHYASSSPYQSNSNNYTNAFSFGSTSISPLSNSYGGRACAFSIRCIREISTLPICGPSLSTISYSSSNVTHNSILCSSSVSSAGGADVTARGFCWSKTDYPTVDLDTKTVNGAGTGDFSGTLTGLEDGTLYYIRAYATNTVGTNYSSQVSITTKSRPTVYTSAVSSIAAKTAVAGGNLTAAGSSSVTARGICWSTTENPTISNNKLVASGTGTGLFSVSLTNLIPLTKYYVRAYATNTQGTRYGEQVEFTTTSGAPVLTTKVVTVNIDGTASSGGAVISNGGVDITAKGVCWSTSHNPTVSNNKTEDGTGSDAYTSSISGLTPGTTYYVRAYATNSLGTGYGDEKVMYAYSDLSASGTANCYMINSAGNYYFRANVIGNGDAGIVAGGNFHTTTSAISPDHVGVLWQSPNGLISNVSLSNDKSNIMLTTPPAVGNAVIAAYDCDNNIIWSWHIWATDLPKEQIYTNTGLDFNPILMDRNLGASSTSDQGLLYQWGRKDPFDIIHYISSIVITSSTGTIENTIKTPDVFYYGSSDSSYDWIYIGGSSQLWGENKTIYDPCPRGWKVPQVGAFDHFDDEGVVAYKDFDYEVYYYDFRYDISGCTFEYDGSSKALFPTMLYIDGITKTENAYYTQTTSYGKNYCKTGRHWLSSASGNNGFNFSFIYNLIQPKRTDSKSSGYAVRCQKE